MASFSTEAAKNRPGLQISAESAAPSTVHAPSTNLIAKVADFEELTPAAPTGASAALDRLLDVTVSVTAELGRATLAVGEVLKLGVGSVVRLDRGLSEPVDLFVQGVRLARGEVVVVDDCFAVRIKEIVASKKHS
jgi:flagellar motor switch protein FliN/FliY